MTQEIDVYLGSRTSRLYFITVRWNGRNKNAYEGEIRFNKTTPNKEIKKDIVSISKRRHNNFAIFDEEYNTDPPKKAKFLRTPRHAVQEADDKWEDYAKAYEKAK